MGGWVMNEWAGGAMGEEGGRGGMGKLAGASYSRPVFFFFLRSVKHAVRRRIAGRSRAEAAH